jgi:DNA polymerase-3 subunit alpha
MYLIYDTETTGLPKDYNAPLTDFENWPRLVQLAWQIHDENGEFVEAKNFIVKPEGFQIPFGAAKIHGITTERAENEGLPLEEVLNEFSKALEKVKIVAGHNVEFDNNIVSVEYLRKQLQNPLTDKHFIDTKNASTDYCALPGGKGGKYKWPNLTELYQKLFNESFDVAHNASADVQATARCFFELIRLGVITAADLKIDEETVKRFIENNPDVIKAVGIEVEDYHETPVARSTPETEDKTPDKESEEPATETGTSEKYFTHLHVHTQFSVLDGLSDIDKMLDKAVNDGMKAVAITDHGNMFGVKKFHAAATKRGIKPIIGCEVYIARRGMENKSTKQDGGGWHLVLLAKNETGYKNLMKLVSLGFTDGYYYKPRIDKKVLKQYSEGLIALTACLGGEIPDKIVHEGIEKAEEALKEYIDIFGDEIYLELQRHKSGDPEMDGKVFENQQYVNSELLKLSEKYNLKVVATNDSHFINAEDADAHDRLLCIGTGKDVDDPKRMKYTGQEWFKTQDEMRALFADIPEALDNTMEIVEKVEEYELNRKPIMPHFEIPGEFSDSDDYLRHLTYEGAKMRYGEITPEIEERLELELGVIKNMGFPDYFLIVWDFLKAARNMGVAVGPGRGSAAGSIVAYCLEITQIDPLKYNLLFERFLNPDRISMPDIDIDFDEDGRDKILKWVADKYGKKRVAHLITFGTMAAKMAIRDVARVQKLPLSEADRLAKMVPDKPGTKLKDALNEVPELKEEFNKGKEEVKSVLKNAMTLEGSIRNTGTHACGIIIARDDLENFVSVSTVKDSVLEYATQFDGKFIEDIGLLKMDFLGLKTLSIIKDALENIKRSKGVDVDIDHVPLDDKATYELFGKGETTGIFQFESDGMRKYLRDLKPEKFDDLIAMVSLYRPGPMDYLPNYIRRKHGQEKIVYDLPEMEEILKETYGITVYQEQVMLLSRKLAGFTRGQSDSLRKAMGKKKKELMEQLKVLFFEGCEKNGYTKEKAGKIWKDWEEFAKYAFNKSHATCYAYIAFQTAYLKAHYPAEFMAAVLSRNLNNIDKITFFIRDTKRMGIKVLGPDINESAKNFTVNKEGVIRFGLAAIKGVGEAAVEEIIRERDENGTFENIFDFAKRVNLRTVNKKSFESLALAGAFDSFNNIHRAQFFYKKDENTPTFIETLIKHAGILQERKNSAQISLFGDLDDAFEVVDPEIPQCEEWSVMQKLKSEKEVTGFYISGHPLDDYRIPLKHLCNVKISALKNGMDAYKNKELRFGGMITKAEERRGKTDNLFGRFTVEDFSGSIDLMMFSEKYLKLRHFLAVGTSVLIKATVEGRYSDENNLSVRVKDIMLLSEASEEMIRNINIMINPQDISGEFMDVLSGLILENKGKSQINFLLSEPKTGKFLKLKSNLGGVNPGMFLPVLEEKTDLKYTVSL